ncbi:hypothetical protein EXU57_06905 [Segetibacter sp. 3557_3]|uniref:hypothetical protein n=1 Tax=Segetibacter sp. 3557_3 TaxID=2547429 RepID=UPI0010587962|nr:hypothetical protein [Segetibacter sp. 3557_3]TDH27312.1 hypothetical protein EXU57_06905 [Segetibacter sp. 3557_3]
MTPRSWYRVRYSLGLLLVLLFSGYYHISNERGYWLHGKLVFPPFIIACIALVGYNVFRKHASTNMVKIWLAFNTFACLLSMFVALLCISGFQQYLPFVEINLVLNLGISPLPYAVIPLLTQALFSGTTTAETEKQLAS